MATQNPPKVDVMAEPKSQRKREFVREYEREIQLFWEKSKVFELNGGDGPETWLGTFPYPYMNGRLHLGHAFTASKVDFAAGYQRLKGKRALFPFGFHCTGMPIKACADKLKREMEIFGNPPVFPVPTEEELQKAAAEAAEKEKKKKEKGKPIKSKKAKTQQKGGAKFQWQIMESSNVSSSEISKFADADYWLRYFPPLAMQDLKDMGSKIDWRRSFITTDVNPYYDAFISWQFRKLRAAGKIKFGKRETIFSPHDNQPCMDHDRQTGEGVGVQEYTLVKQEVLKPYPPVLKSLEKAPQKVYLVPATLRPETMYGQTNCWVLPSGIYGAYQINDKEIFICTPRAARNLAFQEFSPKNGEPCELLKFKGDQLVGTAIRAPLSKYPIIYVYPMFTISTAKTTGVVTSVPSDSPDDYAAFRDIKLKEDLRRKFKLRDDQVDGFDVVPIIEIPDYGKTAAVRIVEELKIHSQNDAEKLKEAKDKVYKEGFHVGIMQVGEHKGKKVSDAKPLIRKTLIEKGLAIRYFEPKKEVISRSGDECVVALCDQWYLDYGEPSWQKQAFECLDQMETFGDEVRNQFTKGLNWIHEWACSRSYGLGSRIPWDPTYLIESLSDSTIYMAFYTISHLLQGGVVDGSKAGPAGISADQLTDEVFDYIYGFRNDIPANTKIPPIVVEQCKKEFETWYPVSLRVSGKDLINNHLIFWIYNHVALFPKDKWPKAVKANGHLLLNGDKMAKRTGNFITLSDAVKRYSSDGMRFALAESGDSIEDPNFTTENADNAILRIHTFVEWCIEMVNERPNMKTGPAVSFAERVFDTSINKLVRECDEAYRDMLFQKAIKIAFFEMSQIRDQYRVIVTETDDKLNWDLICKFIKTIVVLCAPIISHTSEHVWKKILNEKGSIFDSKWPSITEDQIDSVLLEANVYLQKTITLFRSKIGIYTKPPKKATQKQNPYPKSANVYVAVKYPVWYQEILNLLNEIYKKEGTLPEPKVISKEISSNEKYADLEKRKKKVMPIISEIQNAFQTEGSSALYLTTRFDEKDILYQNLPYITKTLKLETINITVQSDTTSSTESQNLSEIAYPGKPLIFFDK